MTQAIILFKGDYIIINTYHATGVSRGQVHNVTKCSQVIEFHYYICNHNGKLMQISTNMPGIRLVIHKIAVEMLRI